MSRGFGGTDHLQPLTDRAGEATPDARELFTPGIGTTTMEGEMSRAIPKALMTAVAIIVGWSLLGAFYLGQDILLLQLAGRQVELGDFLPISAITTILWMLLTPFIVYAAQSITLDRSRWLRSVLLAVVIVIVAALVRIGMSLAALPVMEGRLPTMTDAAGVMAGRFHSNVTLAGIVVATQFVITSFRTVRERERHELILRTQLTRAQLDQLKGQLQPHFLFNALNGIASLIHSDPDRADAMLMKLSDLLRSSLDLEPDDLVPLEDELELTDRYLAIQKMRFDDRLRVSFEIDSSTRQLFVPPFILQPLIENSLKHVVAPRREGGSITISSTVEQEFLKLSVIDDGPGFDPSVKSEGIGTVNVEERLDRLYEGQAKLEFHQVRGGFEARLSIPRLEV